MPTDHAARTARAQLSAIVGEAASAPDPLVKRAALPAVNGPRTAAVLVLFGVLDSLPSDHEAQARAVSRDLDVLLLERAATLRTSPGDVAFPGGRVDPDDESPAFTALREAQEETGLDPTGVEILGTLDNIPLAFAQHVVAPVLAWWQHPSPIRVVDEAESAAVFRAPVADLLNPVNRGVTVIRRDGQEWRGPGFHVHHASGEHLVWGFTAMLLDGLFDRLGWTEPWDDSHELPLVLPSERIRAAGSAR
jgi:8-oxo-dGTP pyrophosphatase MutT (NUDIX family)